MCVFPGLVSRDQETDGQARSPGPSPAAVVSNRPVCSPCVCVCACVNTHIGNFILENTAACINTLFLSRCRIISSNRSHIVKLPLSRVGKPDLSHCIRSLVLHCAFGWLKLLCLCRSPLQLLSQQLKFMHTSHQFLLLSSPPAKEARFRTAKKLYGSTFAFQ